MLNIKNRTIFTRDNLEIMRGINSASVDLIYLDPPFNKKKVFTAPIGTKAEGASFNDIFKRADIKEEWLFLIEHKYKDIFEFINGIKSISKSDYNWCYITYMAIRLLQCHRILKDTGSLYLHCDPTMSHYLKLLLDCIFGEQNFRNEIIWERLKGAGKTSQHKVKSYGRSHEIIFIYTKTTKVALDLETVAIPYNDKSKRFNRSDEQGIYYRRSPFRPPGLGARPLLCFKYKGIEPPHQSGWIGNKAFITKLDKAGDLDWVDNKVYRKQRPRKGIVPNSVWTDISQVAGNEDTGYPTQKPLALLERIIKASTKKGDIVFDPFCGCATTCVAAEILERQWVGVDISPKAYQLVNDRLTDPKQLGILTDAWKFEGNIIQRTDIPTRTDELAKVKYTYKQMRRILFKEQNGRCALCHHDFDERHLEIDHFYPKSLGGTDNIENRQLLCSSCNRIKGSKSMEEAIAIVRKRDLIKQ